MIEKVLKEGYYKGIIKGFPIKSGFRPARRMSGGVHRPSEIRFAMVKYATLSLT